MCGRARRRSFVSAAEEIGADIVAMPTAGHHGQFDALRGSVTERVLPETHCPVLAIPAIQPGLRGAKGDRLNFMEPFLLPFKLNSSPCVSQSGLSG